MSSKIVVLLLLFTNFALAHEKITIQKISELQILKSQLPSPSQTLFVFDIDNTLLRTPQDLGGDAWFTWQEGLLKADPQSSDLVAPDFGGLLTAQGWLFQMSQMISPEVETPQFFRELQAAGYPVILLTSRGPDFENLTQRELARNGYNSAATAIAPRAGFAAPFEPYDLNDPTKSCLTAEDIQRLGLPKSKPVIYRNGVMMTSGQHKGAMLRTLLCKLGRSYSAIVFVDDHQKHVDRVFAAYQDQPGDVRSVKYSFMDVEVKAFHTGDKADVRAKWARLKDAISSIF